MKRQTTVRQKILKNFLLVICGLGLISLGIYSGDWILKKHSKIRERIDLTEFKGEIYSETNIQMNPQIIVEKPYSDSEFNSFLKNPKSILVYGENPKNTFQCYIKIYLIDSVDNKTFYLIKKDFKDEPSRMFNLKHEGKEIIVKELPSPFIYIVAIILFFVSIFYGSKMMSKNIKGIREIRRCYPK